MNAVLDEQRAGARPTGLSGDYDDVMIWHGPPRPWKAWAGTLAAFARELDQATVDRAHRRLQDGRWHAHDQLGVGVDVSAAALWRIATSGVALEARDVVTWTRGQWDTPRGRTVHLQWRLASTAQEVLFDA